jgi:hypothetical protein
MELDANTTIPVPACARQPYLRRFLDLVRARRAVLAAGVEFLAMKVKGADQFLLVFVLVRAMVSRDRAKCNLGTGGATTLDGDVY